MFAGEQQTLFSLLSALYMHITEQTANTDSKPPVPAAADPMQSWWTEEPKQRRLPCMLAATSVQGWQIDSGSKGLCWFCGPASNVHKTCFPGLTGGTPAPQCMRVWHTSCETQRGPDDGLMMLLLLWFGQPRAPYLRLWIDRHNDPPQNMPCVARRMANVTRCDPAWPWL